MVCIVITQNGLGKPYRFWSKEEARLHPIAQAYDVFAGDSRELACQFGRDEIDLLVRFAEGRDKSRLVDAIETWRQEPHHKELPFEARDLFWKTCLSVAVEPPTEASEICLRIQEDRRAMETNKIRSRSDSTSTGDFSPVTSKKGTTMTEATASAATKTRAPRISEDATIKILVDANPKRAGTASAERFGRYKNGMTVKQAKEAGLSSADLAYDSAHDFISITEPAPAKA